MAIQDFYEPLIFIEKKSVSDGMGGFVVQWVDGAEFMGSITTDNSVEMRIAEQQGVKSIYTITTNKNTVLNYNDVIKRKRDNKTFRVTSNGEDVLSPSVSNLSISQVQAEQFDLKKLGG